MERVVLVDGSNLVYRAFFALPQTLRTADGTHTNAVFGFAMMFRKLFAGKTPAYGAVVFDAPGGSAAREAQYAQYKATREAMPNDLAKQIPLVHELVRKNGFTLLQVAGVEADDVIGTLAQRAKAAGHEVHIISSDKDFAQLIDERLKMVDTLRDVTFDAEVAHKKWGVRPDQIVDYLALVGDKIDNVPGVAGIGEKSAIELLATYGSLAGIYAELERPDGGSRIKGRQLKALSENKDNALLSQKLVTLDTDVALPVTLDDLRIAPPDPAELNKLYVDLQFYSLLGAEAHTALAEGDTPADYGAIVDAAELTAFIASFPADSPVAVQPIYDLDPPAITPLVGVALAPAIGRARYVPLVAARGLVASDATRQALLAWLEDASRPKVLHDMKEAWRSLQRATPPIVLRGTTFDTRLASFLVDPTKVIPHRIDQLAKEFLQRTVKPAKSIIGAGQKQLRYSEVEAEALGDWACHIADTVVALHPVLVERVAREGQAAQLSERDLPLSYVLGQMELAGILVDKDNLEALGVEFSERLAAFERDIWRLAGKEFNIASTKQLGEVLFDDLGLPVIKKTKTGYSTDSDVLDALAPKHEIARLLSEHRKLAKLINTYTDVLARSVWPKTGRIHATFQQTTGATGRLISTDPDLQRTPVHTPEGKRIRQAFIAPPGHELLVADWSQIELRLLAHVTSDPNLVDAFLASHDVHRRTASQIFEVPLSAVSPEQRNIGKTINFATIYGQGPSALAQMLGIASKDARRYIDSYFKHYAGVRRWLDQTTEEALRDGYVTTMVGRRRYIPELTSNSPMERQAGIRIACNTPIQGSAADLCKAVMLALAERLSAAQLGARMLLQIHDELVFEVPAAELAATAALVKDVMAHPPGFSLRVPLVADVGHGHSWADAKG
jgi:DNA polymerase I